jgi:hypothetical protein
MKKKEKIIFYLILVYLAVAISLVVHGYILINNRESSEYNYYIPYDYYIDGEIYSDDEVNLAMKYHGTLTATISMNKNTPETNEIFFYRDGQKCKLFTPDAKKYIINRRKDETKRI